jgi:hypothetical protein
MSITQVGPTTVALPAPAAQGVSAPAASPSDPSAARTASTVPSKSPTKADADGDFDRSKTANDDAVKVTLSDAALKTLAAKQKGHQA